MSASPTVYCLEQITDYLQFERLCHDLMVLEGYSSIEPLGGFKDKGRDAIHTDKSDRVTIFAYSVREDWRVKLAEDAGKVCKHGHECDSFVFITTAEFTSSERDEAVGFVSDTFGWKLDLYGVERLRVLLDAAHSHVKTIHPQIFPPPFLSSDSTSTSRDHLLVSYASQDSVFAGWLTQKLTAEDFKVWCKQFEVLGLDYYPDDIDEAIRTRVFKVIAICSKEALSDPKTLRQWGVAQGLGSDSLIPVIIDDTPSGQFHEVVNSTRFISFAKSWATGLRHLITKLDSLDYPRILYGGRNVASSLFLERDVIQEEPEVLFSNCLPVNQVPEIIHRFVSNHPVNRGESRQFRFEWPFRQVDEHRFLSFYEPPQQLKDRCEFTFSGGAATSLTRYIEGIPVSTLTAELIRKSFIVKGHRKGLHYCPVTNLQYFPFDLFSGNRLRYVKPDGVKSYVNTAGERKFWRPGQSTRYRYYLAPDFYVRKNLVTQYTVLVNIRVRITDVGGNPLSDRSANARRKALCYDWWNDAWLNRIFAVCDYFAEDGYISLGHEDNQKLIVSSVPFHLESPIGIDEDRVETMRDQEVRLWAASFEEDEEDSNMGDRDG